MSLAAGRTPGATRTCPHCRTTILESEVVCPACRHHLRAGRATVRARPPTRTPFRLHGSVTHPAGAGAAEYTIIVSVRDARGVELSRHVAGVGALQPGEARAFEVTVETHAAD